MDSVCVGTEFWSYYGNGFNKNITAAIELHVKHWAILDPKSLQRQIRAHKEPYGLTLVTIKHMLMSRR